MRALIIVDLQKDFLPGGSLETSGGDDVVPVINEIMPAFDVIVATRDWHPPDHVSFADNHPGKQPGDVIALNGLEQTLWPVHCLHDTSGAEFPDALDSGRITAVFDKGTAPAIDSYSGFFDNARRRDTGLDAYLKRSSVTEVFIAGLATDVCVQATALDARDLGYETSVVEDACRPVELNPGDEEAAMKAMRDAGVRIVSSKDCGS